MIILENKLNRITQTLLLVKSSQEHAAHYQFETERQLQRAIQNFQIQHEELIGLCEEYWTILRQESALFCTIPARMFKESPALVAQIRQTFILKLLVVSVIGFLTSNEEFEFNDGYLQRQMVCVSENFLTFMRALLNKMTPAMLQGFFWARKLQEII